LVGNTQLLMKQEKFLALKNISKLTFTKQKLDREFSEVLNSFFVCRD
jgi:hypothetical protein